MGKYKQVLLDKVTSIRMTSQLYDTLGKLAAECGQTKSDFIITILMADKVVADALKGGH